MIPLAILGFALAALLALGWIILGSFLHRLGRNLSETGVR